MVDIWMPVTLTLAELIVQTVLLFAAGYALASARQSKRAMGNMRTALVISVHASALFEILTEETDMSRQSISESLERRVFDKAMENERIEEALKEEGFFR